MIKLDERLRYAVEMLQGANVVADIGCDHGKLSAALLLEGGCRRVIAGDISPDCLEKTRQIIDRYGLEDRAEVRLGSGLAILSSGECDAAAILGMGGELIAEILEASPDVAESMERLVLQPMSGIEELRQWLHENSYHVSDDRLISAKNRCYQMLCVHKGVQPDPWPMGFPSDCYLVGYRSFLNRDERLGPYCEEQLNKRREQLKRAAGTAGERKLSLEAMQLKQIIKEIKEWN